jgi:tetraacyldisaccharide 4'-kinase
MNPLAGLYSAAIAVRNHLFDRGSLQVMRLEKPVISVGNLSMGGSGKTPFVIALGESLKQHNIPFDILSRGYRRNTTGVLIVAPTGTAHDFGDEPLLISRRLHVPVIVGESRYDAGRLAEQTFDSQLHILDDGFQHRGLARDFDIVLLTVDDFDDAPIPAGRLREPLSSLERADAVVLPAGAAPDRSVLRGKPVWHVQRRISLSEVPSFPVAFCGIARPQQFFAQLHAGGITPAVEIRFRDHHAYSHRDLQRLLKLRNELNAGGFVTTEKDAINLGASLALLAPVAIARLELTIDRPDDLVNTILQRISARKLPS